MKRIIRNNRLEPHFLRSVERFHGHWPQYFNTSRVWAIAQDVYEIVNMVYGISNAKRHYSKLEKKHLNIRSHNYTYELTLTHEAQTMLKLAQYMPHLNGFNQVYTQCICHPYVDLFMDCATHHLYDQGRLIFNDPQMSNWALNIRFHQFTDALRQGVRNAQVVAAERSFMHEGRENRKLARQMFKTYARHAFVAVELGYQHLQQKNVELQQMVGDLQAYTSALRQQAEHSGAKAFLSKSSHWGGQGWGHCLIVWLDHQGGFLSARNAGEHLIELWEQTVLKQDTGDHGIGAVLYSHVPAPYETAATGWGKKGLSTLPAQEDTLSYLESLSSYIQTMLPRADGVPLIRWEML